MPPVNNRIFSIHINWTYKRILLDDFNKIYGHLFCVLGHTVHKLVSGYQFYWRTVSMYFMVYSAECHRYLTGRWKQFVVHICWYSPTRRPLCECSELEVYKMFGGMFSWSMGSLQGPRPKMRAVWFCCAFPDIFSLPYFCGYVIHSHHHRSQSVLNCVFRGSHIFTLARCLETRK